MFYCLIRSLLFCLPPEVAHHLTLVALKLWPFHVKQMSRPKRVFGLEFPNAVGLAAGLDKNGDYIDALARLGFGFIEVGTVTPKPQIGNPKPRLFRLPKEQALINRMGFNNRGIDYLVERVKASQYRGILGINIGKNATTPLEKAPQDYVICFQKAAPYASYITINISSPNTQGLRSLQHGEFLENLLRALKAEQAKQAKYVPLIVKIAPDLTDDEVHELAQAFLKFKIDGVIASNTTILPEKGGLSGSPLTQKSTEILRLFHQELQGKIPLIAAGGIMNSEDAAAKFAAGADLIQLYTGLIYAGPSLIAQCIKALK